MALLDSRRATGAVALAVFASTGLKAAPLEYTYFVPAPAIEQRGTSPALPEQRLFDSGTSISGRFTYDAAAAIPVGPGPFGGGLVYEGVLTGLQGTIGGFTFLDPAGLVFALNQGLPVPQPPTLVDALVLTAEPFMVSDDFNLQGFQISDSLGTLFTLVDVQLGWLEGDFLDDSSQPPDLLPPDGALLTRVVVEFRAIDDPRTVHVVLFSNGLDVAVVPLPAAAWLMLGALGTLAGLRRARRRWAP